jgi:TfoX/Sxy family transcriptional regulator of competence genes
VPGWVKIPKEHHPIFMAALPDDRRVETILMFGGLAAKVNGKMFAGLFGRSYMVKLSDDDIARANEIGAVPFDPMKNGRVMGNTVQMPDDALDDDAVMRDWLRRGFAYVSSLPASTPKKAAAKKAAPKKATPTPKKAAPKKAAPKKAAPKKAAPKKAL